MLNLSSPRLEIASGDFGLLAVDCDLSFFPNYNIKMKVCNNFLIIQAIYEILNCYESNLKNGGSRM